MVTVAYNTSVEDSPRKLIITESGSSSHDGEGCEIFQSGSGQATVSGNPYSVDQEGSAVLDISRGNVRHSLSQRGSGRIYISGSVGGSINQTGSGVVSVRGSGTSSRDGEQFAITQAGSGHVLVTGNRHSVFQEGSAVLYLRGRVGASVTQSGSGVIDISGSAEGPIQKTGSGIINIHNDP